MSEKKSKEKKVKYFDYNLLFIIIFLVGFGLVMLYSSSSYTSANKFNDSAFYLKLQIRNALIGFGFMTTLALIDYRVWKKWAGIAYILSFFLCCMTLIPGFGASSHGSSRWLQIGPIQFQPSEIAKIAVIIFLAMLLERISKYLGSMLNLIKVFFVLLPLVGLVAYTNLSTAVIIFGIAVCMIFVASNKYFHFIIVGIIGFAFLAVFAMAGYRSDRITAWLSPETAGDKGYQTLQGLYAIGSGGLFGKGLGQSLQKMGNVPETQNDMIFTIICEELGLFGGICVILLFMLLIWRLMIIANNARDLYGALIVVGVMSHIAIQAILNIAVVTNSIPNTGVILPFISYGGTSFAFLMAEVGLVLSVSRGIRLENIK